MNGELLPFIYSVLSASLSPVTPVVLLLLTAIASRRRPRLSVLCSTLALAVTLVCGNGWLVAAMMRSLESASAPLGQSAVADAIVVLSGGTLPAVYPRTTIEVSEAGDRVLYAAELFRQHRAPRVFVTGGVATGGVAGRPAADDMADLLERLNVPRSAVIIERGAQNTHEHAVNLCPMLAGAEIRRVLLVTSAIHMRRSLGVFRHTCPAVDYTPAPTDFRAIRDAPVPWYRHIARIVPTAHSMVEFSDAAHEYVGLLYYRAHGWL